MTHEADDDAADHDTTQKSRFEGVRFDVPFLSFRMGANGWEWDRNVVNGDDDAYERARKRVRARLSFYRHLVTYLAVMAGIAFFDLVTGGGLSGFTLWIGGIWGALLVWQGFNVFVFPAVWSRETEERMIQEELRRQQH